VPEPKGGRPYNRGVLDRTTSEGRMGADRLVRDVLADRLDDLLTYARAIRARLTR
jgi:hypothetical protein